MNQDIVNFIRELYGVEENFIPLHAPVFLGNEKKYLNDCIDSTFVSSVGKYVDRFEQMVAEFVGTRYAVAAVNGTAALHIALQLVGVEHGDEVITQPLTFVATANAIKHAGANPVFVDVDRNTMGMSPNALRIWLKENTIKQSYEASHYEPQQGRVKQNSRVFCINKKTKKRISAIVPMHTFGHPCRIEEIVELADAYGISVVEDAAESLGSYRNDRHTGTFGKLGIFSFNGNKVITTGGGGMIVTDDEQLAKRAKHITTTAKKPHPFEYVHDEIAYNYRLTNLAAALGVAQMEYLPEILKRKRIISLEYRRYFKNHLIQFMDEPASTTSNFWLNTIAFDHKEARDLFLEFSNRNGVMTRPVWTLMNKLEMYNQCQHGDLSNSIWLEERLVNISSGIIK